VNIISDLALGDEGQLRNIASQCLLLFEYLLLNHMYLPLGRAFFNMSQ